MAEWIAKVRVTEVREVIVEGETQEEAKSAAEQHAWPCAPGTVLTVDWEVQDVRPNE